MHRAIVLKKAGKNKSPGHNGNTFDKSLHNLDEKYLIWEECQAGFRRDATNDLEVDRVDFTTELHMSLDTNRARAARRLARTSKKIPFSPCSIDFWVGRDKMLCRERKPPLVVVNSGRRAGRTGKDSPRQSLRLSAVAA